MFGTAGCGAMEVRDWAGAGWKGTHEDGTAKCPFGTQVHKTPESSNAESRVHGLTYTLRDAAALQSTVWQICCRNR
jgi:hypothetical protein